MCLAAACSVNETRRCERFGRQRAETICWLDSWKSAVALTSIVSPAKRALSYALANITKFEALCYKRRPGAMRSAAACNWISNETNLYIFSSCCQKRSGIIQQRIKNPAAPTHIVSWQCAVERGVNCGTSEKAKWYASIFLYASIQITTHGPWQVQIFIKWCSPLWEAKYLGWMHVVQLQKKKRKKTLRFQFTCSSCFAAGSLNVGHSLKLEKKNSQIFIVLPQFFIFILFFLHFLKMTMV